MKHANSCHEKSLCDESGAQFDTALVVDIEQRYCRAPGGRKTDEQWPISSEVIRPDVLARMEQDRLLSGCWIDCRKIRSLLPIAVGTRQREIHVVVRSAVLARDDVLDVKLQFMRGLRPMAILAAIAGANDDRSLCRCVDHFRPPMDFVSAPAARWPSTTSANRPR